MGMNFDPTEILDRAIDFEEIRKCREVSNSRLHPIIDFGIKVFQRCSVGIVEGEDYKKTMLFNFLHFLELCDSADILLSHGATAPVALQLRGMFEAKLAVEYILKEHSQRRADSFEYMVL